MLHFICAYSIYDSWKKACFSVPRPYSGSYFNLTILDLISGFDMHELRGWSFLNLSLFPSKIVDTLFDILFNKRLFLYQWTLSSDNKACLVFFWTSVLWKSFLKKLTMFLNYLREIILCLLDPLTVNSYSIHSQILT